MTENQWWILSDAWKANETKWEKWVKLYSRSQRRTARTLVRQGLLEEIGEYTFKITHKGSAAVRRYLRETDEVYARKELEAWNAKIRGTHT